MFYYTNIHLIDCVFFFNEWVFKQKGKNKKERQFGLFLSQVKCKKKKKKKQRGHYLEIKIENKLNFGV